MNFLAPIMLAGLAALSIPVLLHLMNRVRVKKTPWAAMKFLQTSVKRNRSRVRLQDILLLLIRCALVALAVLAFARPALKGPATQGEAGDGPVAAVVLLDNSASMGRFDGSETCFDKARHAVHAWLEERGQGSMVALHLVSNRTESLMAKPEPNLALLRGLLQKVALSDRSTDLVDGIRLACESLREVQGLPREVHVFTDGQASAWAKEEDLKRIAETFPEIRIIPTWIGEQSPANVAIIDVRVEGGLPAARQTCRLVVEVANYSDEPVRDVKVSLALNARAPDAQAVIGQIEPGRSQAVALMVNLPEAGLHEITAVIGPDALPVDNQRTLVINVAAQTDVLLVEEDHAAPAMDRDGYFLANALVPTARENAARYYLGATFISPATLADELANQNHQSAQAVFLSNVGALSDSAVAALRDYVNQGGSLMVFPGPRTTVADWQSHEAWWDMLPAELAEPVILKDNPLAWQSTGLTHPVTVLWNDAAQGSLSAIRFHQYFPLKLKSQPQAFEGAAEEKNISAGADAQVISRFVDGSPSVVEWQLGKGHVVLFSSTATPEWNNLPLHPAFVPYLQRLMGHLNRSHAARLAVSPGSPFRLALEAMWQGKEVKVMKPGAQSPVSIGQVLGDESGTFLRFSDTEKTGPYRLLTAEENELLGMFAVQMDPRESNLQRVSTEAVQALLEVDPQPLAESGAATLPQVVKQEFWTPLLWLVAALFVVEGLLAHRFSRAKAA